MKTTVYVETTIPSYYFDKRSELANDIQRTRQWWDEERSSYECFLSVVVVDELGEGVYPHQADCLMLVADLPRLEITEDVLEIADVYWARQLMPRLPVRDALHLAVASYYRMDVLLTWNCRHLANANKFPHLARLNQTLGLSVPQLVTPMQLTTWEE
jgi:predicted nucleic acid-binding protein